MKHVLFSAALLTVFATSSFAQTKPSPPAETHVAINGKSITIKYSAPSVRGRKIFGGLVPYGKVWRAGANDATALHTDAELDFERLKVPAGDYTLYVLPEDTKWTLIVNKQTGQWGTEYDKAQDLGRVPMEVSKAPSPIERYQITLSSKGGNHGRLQMAWDTTVATASFSAK
jgi:hypothetical protein